jgi:hypothetical protein
VETLAANGQDVMAAEDMLSKPEIQRIFEQQYRDVVVDAVMPELESVASDRTSNAVSNTKSARYCRVAGSQRAGDLDNQSY